MTAAPSLAQVARLLMLEAQAVRVSDGLAAAGVLCLVLKGVSTNAWLYGDTLGRLYSDVDVLVAPAHWAQAGAALESLGFVNRSQTVAVVERLAHEEQFVSDHGVCVDLHRFIVGMTTDSAALWPVLWSHREPLAVRTGTVRVLDLPARCLHVAVHAAAGGRRDTRAYDVLDLAISQSPPSVWPAAASLAQQVDAREALGAGLRLHPAGRSIADGLDLPVARDVDVILRASSAPYGSRLLQQALATHDRRTQLSLMAVQLFPSRSRMLQRYPQAASSRTAMVRARLRHIAQTLRELPGVIRQLWAARRSGRAATTRRG